IHELLGDVDWYLRCSWCYEYFREGYYRLRLPVPGSNERTFSEQVGLLAQGEHVAPVVVALTALLVHRLAGRKFGCEFNLVRCHDRVAEGKRVALTVLYGCVLLECERDTERNGSIWLSAARRAS